MKLVVNNLACERGGRRLFSGLSFAVAAGEAFILTGPNGSGKTTLIRILAGFLRPASGTVHLEGGAPDLPLGEQSHYVGHLDGNKASLTVAENLAFWSRYLGAGAEVPAPGSRLPAPPSDMRASDTGPSTIGDVLWRLKLHELADIPAGYLSAGQRRRLGLSRLLVAARPVWLLDEPTVSLDRASSLLVAGMVEDHIGNGGIVVAATHLPLGLERSRELDIGEASARIGHTDFDNGADLFGGPM